MAAASETSDAEKLLADPETLKTRIGSVLQNGVNARFAWNNGYRSTNGLSVVLFLLGLYRHGRERLPVPCLILNKRSDRVPQPGDLCCPGGGIAPRVDRLGAQLLRLPLSPLRHWPSYNAWRAEAPRAAARLRLLMAAGLREGMEEMRLNPLGVQFLGGLPAEHLVMFKRTIVPLVAWVHRQRYFRPNWEVERIVRIPLRDLLSPGGYVALRLRTEDHDAGVGEAAVRSFPAFRFPTSGGTEILWGATFRITMHFLEQVFGFHAPDQTGGVTIEKRLTADYVTGRG